MSHKKIHLVSNAHLDPVWLWEWPEGAAEALSTFRTAAALCEEFGDFVFSHNEAILYQWVEAHEPALFQKIQGLVRRKKWNILGGWFLQPDCNMPSGESLVRQILLGKAYFKEKFGVTVRTASNLDPFGHTRGLVQILAKSGYHSYLFCRPDKGWLNLPADEFIWMGYDGSEILAARAEAHYNSRKGFARAKIEDWIKSHPEKDVSLLLWGVGNHGGGASRKDLQDIETLRKEIAEFDIVHSTAEAYFEELAARSKTLPRFALGLNPWAVGCYTTMARVKQRHRALENELFSAEKMASAAAFQGFMKYPADKLAEAQRDLAFAEFHDLLPGSSIGPGEEGALRLLDHGLEICSRVKAAAFFALAAAEKPAEEGELPVFVYNPHPFAVKAVFETEFQEQEPNYAGGFMMPRLFRRGKPLPCQVEKEASNLSIEWRKKAVFAAEIEPGCMNRFIIRLENTGERPRPGPQQLSGTFRFRTSELGVDIGASTGLIEQYRVRQDSLLAGGAFRPLVIEDNSDPWGMSVRSFRHVVGAFELLSPGQGTWLSGVTKNTLPSVRVVEDGDVRTVVEAVLGYGHSFMILRYKLPKQGTEVEVEARVHWNEKDRMLKLSIPTLLPSCQYIGQTAYGSEELLMNGDEAISQKWAAAVSSKKNLAISLINDGVYGSDFCDGELRISLLRGAAHAADPAGERPLFYQDRYIPRIDQGERVFHFWLNGGKASQRLEAIDREALARNEKPYVLIYSPPGSGEKALPFVVLRGTAVVVTALKKAERGRDIIIRLFEPTGKARSAMLELPFANAKINVHLRAFEIKTLRFSPKTKKFREVDLTEGSMSSHSSRGK
jgi:alpha-mannosidase